MNEKLKTAKVKQHLANKQYDKAQEAYEDAAAKHLSTSKKLRRARHKAKVKLLGVERAEKATAKLFNSVDYNKIDPELTQISPNHSSRLGVAPRKIVLHITVSHNRPGLADIQSVLDFFGMPSAQASSHIINDREGHDARCVRDIDKAWTQAAENPDSLSIEQIQYADMSSPEEWKREARPQLENTAAWIAHWSHLYNIPIRHDTDRGVCEHRELGMAGGGHADVGPNYPMRWVLMRAREIKQAKYGS